MNSSLQRLLKLAYFSPLAPQRSGISEYSLDLLPYLAPWAEVHLFIDDYIPSDSRILQAFPVWNYRDYPWRREVHQYDLTIYQMGNSPAHGYCYPYLTEYPGVVVLHDFVLHHLLAGVAVASGDRGLYVREMAYAYGLPGIRIARAVLTGQQEPPFFQYPLCQKALDGSLGVLVHSRYVLDRVRGLAPEVPVAQLPMGIPLPPALPAGQTDLSSQASLRRGLDLPESCFILGSFGEATEHKRIPVVLRSLAQLLAEGIDAYYVVVGNLAAGLDLERHAERLGLTPKVRVTGFQVEEVFNAYLKAVDVCVNLRYPTAGETSASALRSMGAGLPTIVSDVDANRELPDSSCIKLPVDQDEEALLTKALQLLATNRELREQLGRNARQYVRDFHSMERAARGYVAFIEELLRNPQVTPTPVTHQNTSFDIEYLSVIARHLHELGLEGRDLFYLQDLGQALTELGLDPRRGGNGGEDSL